MQLGSLLRSSTSGGLDFRVEDEGEEDGDNFEHEVDDADNQTALLDASFPASQS